VDLDHDYDLDAIFAGDGGVIWVRNDLGVFSDGGAIVPAADGAATDVVTVDLDGDHDVELIVTFADGPARLYWQDTPGTFTRDATWAGALPSGNAAALCGFLGGAAPQLVLAGSAGVEAYALGSGAPTTPAYVPGPGIPGVGPATEIACGTFSNGGTAFLETTGAVVVVGATGAVWSSALDLDPAVTFDGRGLAAADLDHDWIPDLAISVAGADAPFVFLRGTGSGFVVTTDGIDVAPGLATTRATITHL
jgi:hypothetical protein